MGVLFALLTHFFIVPWTCLNQYLLQQPMRQMILGKVCQLDSWSVPPICNMYRPSKHSLALSAHSHSTLKQHNLFLQQHNTTHPKWNLFCPTFQTWNICSSLDCVMKTDTDWYGGCVRYGAVIEQLYTTIAFSNVVSFIVLFSHRCLPWDMYPQGIMRINGIFEAQSRIICDVTQKKCCCKSHYFQICVCFLSSMRCVMLSAKISCTEQVCWKCALPFKILDLFFNQFAFTPTFLRKRSPWMRTLMDWCEHFVQRVLRQLPNQPPRIVALSSFISCVHLLFHACFGLKKITVRLWNQLNFSSLLIERFEYNVHDVK